jgi:hypothetical protein
VGFSLGDGSPYTWGPEFYLELMGAFVVWGESDGQAYWSVCTNGSSWSAKLPIPGATTEHTCGVVTPSDGFLPTVAYRKPDGTIWLTTLQNYLDQSSWSAPTQLFASDGSPAMSDHGPAIAMAPELGTYVAWTDVTNLIRFAKVSD